ncbi:nucleotidyltransferase domain-containing protein [Brevibacillus sp. M2.1A]|uniref:nucleotidyltransferase domain-containing protein n=1 Tax=Brevibacillus TaxID=55080 RepID=UPI00156BA903|nr:MULTISPECIES: nucleotidyltransferase domain-containing protein [Brevibacillus]MBY0088644.1 nucleotidyltransferase domain-containing protein [Brevibacillus brevis]MCC8437128.1 nucleotidyltransferase domain-containing protein [Brevibacillus sp. M2.1A]MCE0449718.1 nucleotidyltransferase domain-containing protein [Brevibacillus sp. AF8]UKK99279.1 oxalate:formate antiporter [Brevibacillus brevis]
MKLPLHDRFIQQAIKYVSQDQRLIGLLAGGSMMYGEMDEYSDLDLIIVYNYAFRNEIMEQRFLIAERLGHLLSAFTGEHVGEPRLLICLYGPAPLHVDLKFVQLEELESRVENPLILWESGSGIATILSKTSPSLPFPHPQWIEDRFWVWVHYCATKLGRGELFELIDTLTFMRNAVLGPLVLIRNGHSPRGVRKLEKYALKELEELKGTIPIHSFESCYHALKNTIKMYQQLRQGSEIEPRKDAERVSIEFLDGIFSGKSH